MDRFANIQFFCAIKTFFSELEILTRGKKNCELEMERSFEVVDDVFTLLVDFQFEP